MDVYCSLYCRHTQQEKQFIFSSSVHIAHTKPSSSDLTSRFYKIIYWLSLDYSIICFTCMFFANHNISLIITFLSLYRLKMDDAIKMLRMCHCTQFCKDQFSHIFNSSVIAVVGIVLGRAFSIMGHSFLSQEFDWCSSITEFHILMKNSIK